MTKIKQLGALLLVLVAIGAFFWVANLLGSGEKVESEKPLVICQPQNAPPEKQRCFWTAHIHAHVEVFKKGNRIPLNFEQGILEGIHTHSEKDKIHWHGLIPVDPTIKEVRDWSALKVENLPRDLKLSIEGTPKFIVNSKEVVSSYIWQDGDHIEIKYE